jgi:hypothetical protein
VLTAGGHHVDGRLCGVGVLPLLQQAAATGELLGWRLPVQFPASGRLVLRELARLAGDCRVGCSQRRQLAIMNGEADPYSSDRGAGTQFGVRR